ncbi:Miniconductance mechanosensitive channel MscM precursor [Planctomycetes bacterium CA13]|uniref:Miniconductance mechanosensitive channel MscM n=1 Tax=Novipirellula herctigrandis TaxID=2527986 RepID=A0A5C5Z1I9_9BACT|nr:Miniconductance mechanosensitive channel MscM precursor [Planctomycetes bacterium CA13]
MLLALRNAIFLALLVMCFSALLPAQGQAQLTQASENADGPAPVVVTEADIDQEAVATGLAEVKANDGLKPSVKTALEDLYQQAQQKLQAADASVKNASDYEKMVLDAADQIRQTKLKLDEPLPALGPLDADATVESIKQRLTAKKSELELATKQKKLLEDERSRRQERLGEIPAERIATEEELEKIDEQLSRQAPPNEIPLQTRARVIQLKASRQSRAAKLAELSKEQAAYGSTVDLLPLQVQLSGLRVTALQAEANQLAAALIERQRDVVADRIESLTEMLAETPEQLKPIAKQNIEIARQQQDLVRQAAEASSLLAESEQSYRLVKAAQENSEERLEKVGLTDALGVMLRDKQSEFQQLRAKFQPRTDLREKIQQYQINAFELEDNLDQVEIQLESLGDSPESVQKQKLLRQQKSLLSDTLVAQNSLLQTMLDADTHRRELRQAIDHYIRFVDENLFWIRSSPAFSVAELKEIVPATAWMTKPSHWRGVLSQWTLGAFSQPISSMLAALVAIGLFVYRPRCRHVLEKTAKEASLYRTTFAPTAKALLATVILSLAWPVVFAVMGWLLKSQIGGGVFVHGVGSACVLTAVYVASRELMKHVCRPYGLAEAHFGWDEPVRSLIRFHLRWYTVTGAILVFLMWVFREHPNEVVRTSLSRLTAIALFIATATFHHLMFRVNSPIYVQTRRENPDSQSYRWRRLIWLVAIGLPISFAVFAFMGFLDTAFTFGELLQASILFLVFVLLLTALIFRVLSLHYRDVARRQAMERREKKLSALTASSAEGLTSDIGIEIQEEEAADLPKLDRQTRQLFHVTAASVAFFGLLFIWSDVLPAIKRFNQVELWTVGMGETVEAVTLRDLIYVFVTIVGAIFAVRNLPSLLELSILRRTSLDSGARYALTTILRYVLTVIAAILILNLLSIPWTQLGWLLAAASVGLGFGLQEIVANFVSGIILLLERPVRVGDVVTIDGTTGIVSRIQMRATTVTSWDRKELVVPNKDLITEKLLNWSLSNVINRLTINVGVDYDSDPHQVQEILLRVVSEHPDVMNDPAPLINFDNFGDNSLNYAVRFYLSNLDRRVGVTHEINIAVLQAFREAGISIPFPQRDVHMK